MSSDLERLQASLREFTRRRGWEQYHTPKNLVMALAGEVGELVEIFQWLTPEQSTAVLGSARAADVTDEMADVLIYLARLADVLGVDLLQEAADKVAVNESRFPPRGAD